MILQNYLASIVQSRTNGCQLNQNFRAINTVFYHPFHLFQVADGSSQPVNDRFLIFVDMAVGVGDAVGVEISVVVVFVMIGHMGPSCGRFSEIIAHFGDLCNP